VACGLFVLHFSLLGNAPANPWGRRRTAYAADVCRLLDENAARNNLPVHFLARLIGAKALFDDHAVSPAGAEGIAQFMPQTARLRGLANSFDYREALPRRRQLPGISKNRSSAIWGLPPQPIILARTALPNGWKATPTLPDETEDYVLEITGHEASAWKDPKTSLDIRHRH